MKTKLIFLYVAVGQIVAVCLLLTSCARIGNAMSAAAAWNEQYGDGFWQLAQQACGRAQARRRSIDLQAAKEKFCSTEEQLEPWKDVLLRAERAGARRANIEAE